MGEVYNKCKVRGVMCNVQRAGCNVQRATCGVQRAACNVRGAVPSRVEKILGSKKGEAFSAEFVRRTSPGKARVRLGRSVAGGPQAACEENHHDGKKRQEDQARDTQVVK